MPLRAAVATASPLMPPAPTTAARSTAQVAQDARGLLEAHLHERDAVPVDVRLGVGPLAHPKGLLEEGVERLARHGRLLGHREGVAHLTEDLRLPTAIESRPQATVKVWATAPSS